MTIPVRLSLILEAGDISETNWTNDETDMVESFPAT